MKPSSRSNRLQTPTFQPNRRTVLLGSAAGLLLTACGGGDGDADVDAGGTTLPPTTPDPASPWATPLMLTASASLNASLLNIASNDAGDALAVWEETSSSGVHRLLGRRYRADVGWDPVHEIATTTEIYHLVADVAMDASGQAWVVWTQRQGASFQTSAMRHLPSGGWQAAEKVNTTDDASLAEHARVSVDAQGNALVGWIAQRYATTPQVRVRPWVAGVGWGSVAALNTFIDTDPTELVLALAPAGQAVVGWIEPRGANPSVWAARWSLAAGAAPDAAITAVGHASELRIACDASGVTLLAWRHVFAAAERVSTVRFPASGNPAAWTSRDNPAPGAVGRPGLDAGGAGHFALVWDEVLNGQRDAWGTLIGANDSATPSTLLENDAGADAHHVQVALDANNQAQAVWLRGAASQGEIWSARQPFNGAWTAAERIGNDTGDATSLHLRGSAGGRALVAWLQPEGAVHRVWVQHRQPD